MQATSLFRIHPAIGIARVGNADPSTFFIGPEVPGYPALPDPVCAPVPSYKDASNRVRPQGARFRVFDYRYINGGLTPYQEVNLNTASVAKITWTVHVANKKAAFYLENNSAGDSTSGISPPLPGRHAAQPVNDQPAVADQRHGPRTIAGATQTASITPDPNDPTQSIVFGADGNPLIPYTGQRRTPTRPGG